MLLLCAIGSVVWSPWGNHFGLKIQKNSNNLSIIDLEQFLAVHEEHKHDAVGSSELGGYEIPESITTVESVSLSVV